MQDPSYMKKFSRIPYEDIEIDFLEDKGFIGYTFQYEGRNYGTKVVVNTRKRKDLVEAIAALFINAISSYQKIINDSAISTGTGTKSSKLTSSHKRKSK